MFCANFDYSQIGWPPYHECWHRDCLSANPDRELYYYGVMEDVEDTPWDYNPKDKLRYKHLTNGFHLFMPFLGPTWHLCNLQYRLPTGSAKDRVFVVHITRFILNEVWGR